MQDEIREVVNNALESAIAKRVLEVHGDGPATPATIKAALVKVMMEQFKPEFAVERDPNDPNMLVVRVGVGHRYSEEG